MFFKKVSDSQKPKLNVKESCILLDKNGLTFLE